MPPPSVKQISSSDVEASEILEEYGGASPLQMSSFKNTFGMGTENISYGSFKSTFALVVGNDLSNDFYGFIHPEASSYPQGELPGGITLTPEGGSPHLVYALAELIFKGQSSILMNIKGQWPDPSKYITFKVNDTYTAVAHYADYVSPFSMLTGVATDGAGNLSTCFKPFNNQRVRISDYKLVSLTSEEK